jgi:hypothetical protein
MQKHIFGMFEQTKSQKMLTYQQFESYNKKASISKINNRLIPLFLSLKMLILFRTTFFT